LSKIVVKGIKNMARAKKSSGKSTSPEGFSEKSWNKLPDSWKSAAASKQTDELEKDLIKAVRNMSNTSFDMKNDDKLKVLQEEAKELKSCYTEVIEIEKAKIDYCVYLFNSRGMAVTVDTDEDE